MRLFLRQIKLNEQIDADITIISVLSKFFLITAYFRYISENKLDINFLLIKNR